MKGYEGIPLSEACPRNGGPPSKPLWFIGLLDSEPEASCLQNAWNRSTIVWPCLTNARNVFSQFSQFSPISVSTKESAIKLSGPSTWHSISRASVNVKLQWLQWLPATSGRVGTFYLFELKFELFKSEACQSSTLIHGNITSLLPCSSLAPWSLAMQCHAVHLGFHPLRNQKLLHLILLFTSSLFSIL